MRKKGQVSAIIHPRHLVHVLYSFPSCWSVIITPYVEGVVVMIEKKSRPPSLANNVFCVCVAAPGTFLQEISTTTVVFTFHIHIHPPPPTHHLLLAACCCHPKKIERHKDQRFFSKIPIHLLDLLPTIPTKHQILNLQRLSSNSFFRVIKNQCKFIVSSSCYGYNLHYLIF